MDYKKIGEIYVPKEPLGDFLGKSAEHEKLKPIFFEWHQILDKCLTLSAECFDYFTEKAATSQTNPKDPHAPIILLYRQILEYLDSVSVLVKEGCSEPIKPLIRGMFEAYLYLEYILQSDWEQRALCYIVGTKRTRKQLAEMFDPETDRGREYSKFEKQDKILSNAPLNASPPMQDNKEPSEYYKRIHVEWERMMSGRRRRMHWYSMFNGPGNLAELSEKVNLRATYDVIYRLYSDYAHIGQVMGSLIRENSGKANFISLRHPRDTQDLVTHALWISCFSIQSLLEFYGGDKKVQIVLKIKHELLPQLEKLSKVKWIQINQ